MIQIVKLTKTDEFSSVFSFRKRISAQFLVWHYQPNAQAMDRLGLVVSKKVAKRAVDRNYMRRVLRALFQQQQPIGAVDIVVRVQKPFTHGEFWQVAQEFETLAAKLRKRLQPDESVMESRG